MPGSQSATQIPKSLNHQITRSPNECGSSSAVERGLPKPDVAGSIPVSRSNPFTNLRAAPGAGARTRSAACARSRRLPTSRSPLRCEHSLKLYGHQPALLHAAFCSLRLALNALRLLASSTHASTRPVAGDRIAFWYISRVHDELRQRDVPLGVRTPVLRFVCSRKESP